MSVVGNGSPGGGADTVDSARAAFLAAYDALLARWPVPVEPVDVPTPFGATRVQVCGPADGTPLVLLHGGGATSTVWFANVGELSRVNRVYAVDVVGDAGRSVADGRPLRDVADLLAWLDAVLDGLRLSTVRLCGHSYHGWLALRYAANAPDRVSRLALLDPTDCFAGLRWSYRLHAVPLLARPSPERMGALLRWETGGAPLDPGWLDVVALGTRLPRSPIVLPRRPGADLLRRVAMPTLVVVAGASRAHDARRVADRARRALPDVAVEVLPRACHHSIPLYDPQPLNAALTAHFR
ncbi:MAG TPA: alpha/beta fold hydrolase [Micromonosporaceae bacterium]